MVQITEFERQVQNLIEFLNRAKSYPKRTVSDIYEILVLCQDLTSEYDESHNMQHHIEVYKTAIDILSTDFESDMNPTDFEWIFRLITYACLLHDTIDHKYPANLENKTLKLNNFLMDKFGENWIEVKWVIDNISYSKEKKSGYPQHPNKLLLVARDIVSDADKIQALGEIGLDRCRQFTIEINPEASETEVMRLVVAHCHDKLLKLKDFYIRTNRGKQLAELGHEIIAEFCNSYEKSVAK